MGRPALHFHISHLHHVVPECVEKLLLVVSTGWVRTHSGGPVWARRGRRGRGVQASMGLAGTMLVRKPSISFISIRS